MNIPLSSIIYHTAKILSDENHILEMGENCFIGDYACVYARKLVMKNDSQINPHAIIGGGGTVVLGERSVVGFGAKLFPATDTPEGKYMCESAPDDERMVIRGSIELGEGAYVGSGAVICVGKRCTNIYIGEHSVIGALCYIDSSIPHWTVVHPKRELIFKSRCLL